MTRGFYAGAPFTQGWRKEQNMARSPKRGFSRLPGFPGRDDKELQPFMDVVARLPREKADELARSFLRAALGWERGGDPAHLTELAEDTLFTMRLRSDPRCKDEFENEQPRRPYRPDEAMDVETLLARHGMA